MGTEEGLRTPAGRLDLGPFALGPERVSRAALNNDRFLQRLEVCRVAEFRRVDRSQEDVSDPQEWFVTASLMVDAEARIEALASKRNEVPEIPLVLGVRTVLEQQIEHLHADHLVIQGFEAFSAAAFVSLETLAEVSDDNGHRRQF
jgi:hypothetical protein